MASQLQELFQVPFLSRTPEEQKRIIMEGKPQPALTRLKTRSVHPVSKTKYNFVFDVASYGHVEWLTGCEHLQALFCWPCVLFRGTVANEITADNLWNTIGLINLLNLHDEILNHSKSESHIQSTLNLKLFAGYTKEDSLSNSVASKGDSFEYHCKLVRRLTEVVCFIVSQKVPEKTDHRNVIKTEECVQYLKLQRRYDIRNSQLIDDTINLLKTNSNVLTGIIRSVIDVMEMAFRKEMEKAEYVSVIVSEHSKKDESQYSLVLRYVKDGEVCERFVGFVNSMETHPVLVGDLINKFINDTILLKFKIHKKILAFSFDESPTLQYVKNLRTAIGVTKNVYYDVPCYFHTFEFLLLQSLRFYHGCDSFSKHMLTLRSFFEYGTKMRQELQSYLEGKLNFTNIPILDFSANFLDYLSFLKNHRTDLLSFLSYKMNNHDSIDDTDLAEVCGLHAFLKDFESVFLIETFIKLFSVVLPLCDNRAFDSDLDIYSIQSVQNALESAPKGGSFNNLWDTVIREYKELVKPQTITVEMETKLNNRKKNYHGLYINIFRLISNQTKNRLDAAKECVFLNLLNFRKQYPSRQSGSLKKIESDHGTVFGCERLRDELCKLERNLQICKCDSIYKLKKFFLSRGLVALYPNVYKLIDLALALPCTLPESEESSTWNDIKAWSYSPEEDKIVDNMSLLYVEAVYLNKLKEKASFCDDVITQMSIRNNNLFFNLRICPNGPESN